MSTHWIHDLIKAQIALKSANSTENIILLNDLKQFFYDEIGSERRFACIKSFEDLLDVLESRATFTEKDICTAMDNIQMSDCNPNDEFPIELFHCNRDTIYNFIASLIGEKWLEFGHQLHMSKEILDDLKRSYYEDNSTKIKKILEMYELYGKNDGQKIINGICGALTACQCKDVSQYVQNLLWR